MIPVIRRLGWSVAVLVGVSLLTFCLAFLVPSDPALTLAGPKADAETLASIRRSMGLDQPVLVQYARYLGRLLQGDLGRSYLTRQDVASAIGERLPATAILAAASLGLATVVGVLLACWSALRQGSRLEVTVLIGSLVALSVPVFWSGMLLLYVFAYRLQVLPLGGFGAANLLLPATALALATGGYYTRLLHTNLRAVLHADYVRTARAKGLGPLRVYGRHALRNALIPLITVVGLDFASFMGGVVLTETVFNWPGLGRLAVQALFDQDIPMIMGTVLFSAVVVIAINAVVDLVYAVVDPRIRYQ
jgi:peptide/nickel transport system permease protein